MFERPPLSVYMAANISGGHLNPAVTMSTLMCGFYVRSRSFGRVASGVGWGAVQRGLSV